MEDADKTKLRLNRIELVEGVLFSDIKYFLQQEGILHQRDVQTIERDQGNVTHMERLLDLLEYRGPGAYKIFEESLQEKYKWIKDKLNIEHTSQLTGIRMRQERYSRLMINRVTLVRNVKLNDVLNALIAGEIIIPSDQQRFESGEDEEEKVGRLLDHLKSCDDVAYDIFNNALSNSKWLQNILEQTKVIYADSGDKGTTSVCGTRNIVTRDNKSSKECETNREINNLIEDGKKNARIGIDAMKTVFVRTRAVDTIEESLEQSRIAIVTGNSGDGKTYAALHVMDRVCQGHVGVGSGWLPVILKKPEDIVKVSGYTTEKFMILVDNFLGATNFNVRNADSLADIFESIENILKSNSILLILVSRSHVFEEAKGFLKEPVLCDLFSMNNFINLKDIALSVEEKVKMLRKHIQNKQITAHVDVDQISHIDTVFAFPLHCKYLVSLKTINDDGVEFFLNPRPLMISYVEELSKGNKSKFAVLIYMLFNNDQLNLHEASSDTGRFEANSRKLMEIAKSYKLPNLTLDQITEDARSLQGVFVSKNEFRGNYTFSHESIKEAVTIVCSSIAQQPIVELAPLDYLLENMATVKTKTEKLFVIVRSEREMKILAKRFFAELENEKFLVLRHRVFQDSDFIEVFISEITTISKTSSLGKHTLNGILCHACFIGNEKLVLEMVENCAEIACVYNDTSPIHEAAVNGKVKIVELLVNKGAHVMALDGRKRTSLWRASQNGHVNVVEYLVENGADVKASNKDQRTPLHMASYNGHVDVVKYLVENGADLKASDKNQRTPLWIASCNGHVDVVKYLVENGADEKASDNDRYTPLWTASHNGHVDVVKYLVENGADVKANDKDQDTPLHMASCNDHIDVVKYLVENGADVKASDKDQCTPLWTASHNGHVDVVKYLVENGADVKANDKDQDTPLHMASCNDHIDVVRYLVGNGADVKARDKDRRTPLWTASRNGHVDVVKYLTENGADVKASDKDQRTSLHMASYNGHVDVVKYLVDNGADVKASDNDQRTPLWTASYNGHVDIVKYLMENGADVKSSDNDQCTTLWTASHNGHVDVVKYLVENGADVNASDKDQCTPLWTASHNGHVDVVNYLEEKGADVKARNNDRRTPLWTASHNGHVDVVKYLVDNGADVKASDKDQRTPLWIASCNGHVDVVKYLVDSGADVKASDNDRYTPLHLASNNGHVDVVMYLVENGADVKASDNGRYTPLHLASYNGHVDVVKYLVKNGADVKASDNDRYTPLHLASQNNHVDVAKYLSDSLATFPEQKCKCCAIQ